MSKSKKIEGTAEAWESGLLGCDESFAKLSDLDLDAVRSAAGLKSISLRMQPDLLHEIKLIAEIHGIGYQPLIKQILRRFVDGEMKMLLRDAYREQVLKKHETDSPEESPEDPVSDCA